MVAAAQDGEPEPQGSFAVSTHRKLGSPGVDGVFLSGVIESLATAPSLIATLRLPLPQ
jgi:hypothetical protein